MNALCSVRSSIDHAFDVFFAGFNFDTDDGDKVLPGFLDSIVGIQRGETKSFSLVFPESWKQENLRGVNAQFTVSISSLWFDWHSGISKYMYRNKT